MDNDSSKWKSCGDDDGGWPDTRGSGRGVKIDLSDYYQWEAQKLKYKKMRRTDKNNTVAWGGSWGVGSGGEEPSFREQILGGEKGRGTKKPFGVTGGLSSKVKMEKL